MGDVDFLVPPEFFDDAMKLMESNGYIYSHGKGEDGRIADNSRHIGYCKNGIEFELHHHFSSKGFDMDDILERAIYKREFCQINGYRFPMLPYIENGLVLLGHIHQHLIIDNLGLRQIIDWEMYLHSVMKSEKWKNEFVPIAKEIGLLELAGNVTGMCQKYLGLSECIKAIDSVKEDVMDELLENLLNSGNFGSKQIHSTPNIDSGERIRKVTSEIYNKGFFSYLQSKGLEKWKLCKKYPVLKPIAFIYGFFRFCIRGAMSIIKTGKIKEQIQYIKIKNERDKDFGIRRTETKKKDKRR